MLGVPVFGTVTLTSPVRTSHISVVKKIRSFKTTDCMNIDDLLSSSACTLPEYYK